MRGAMRARTLSALGLLPGIALAGMVLFGAAAGTASAPGRALAGAPARPNVVVVMTDDQTQESMRVMSNVQRLLAQQGTTFANSFASFPLCCPSRATFLTGQYPHNSTILGNALPQGGYQKLRPTHANTLPAWLQQAGYRTVHIGKYLNGYGRDNPRELPAGWSEWYGSVDPATYRFYGYRLNERGTLVDYGARPEDYQADVYARKSVEAIRRLAPQAQPFFLSVAFLAPHSGGPREADDPRNQATPVPAPRHRNRFASEPLPASPSFNEADVSDKPLSIRRRAVLGPQRVAGVTENYRQRLESLLAVDEAVAAIVAALEASGELQRTLILFTADNGFFHGEHRVPAGKVLVYEPSARVPLIVRGPGVPRGRVHQQFVTNVDWAATIVDAANARAGRRLDGRSLVPLAQNPTRRWGRDLLFETPSYSALRTPRWLWVEHGTGERELYDLSRDPHQLQSQHANGTLSLLRQRLAARLARLRVCAGPACAAGPNVRLAVSYRRGARGCVRSAVGVRLAGPETATVVRTDFHLAARRVRMDTRAPFRATIPRARLSTAGNRLLRVTVTFADGRVQTLDRLLRRCA
jgi:arylsulfatase A-like enzyme